MRRVSLLGATGSIGDSALDVVARHPDRYAVAALAAHRNVATLAQIGDLLPNSQGLIERLSDEELAANPNLTPQKMRENMTIGTAAEVIERLKVYEGLGYDEYSFWIDTGMSFERKKASLERFIADVMPAFG